MCRHFVQFTVKNNIFAKTDKKKKLQLKQRLNGKYEEIYGIF